MESLNKKLQRGSGGKGRVDKDFARLGVCRNIPPKFLTLLTNANSLFISTLHLCYSSLHSLFWLKSLRNYSEYIKWCVLFPHKNVKDFKKFWFLIIIIIIIIISLTGFQSLLFPLAQPWEVARRTNFDSFGSFYLYLWKLAVQTRKLFCFVNHNEYLGMQMSMWVLCHWNRKNKMFFHLELRRNCLPGNWNQHINK